MNTRVLNDEHLTNENGNLKRLPSDFYYDFCKFNGYKYKKDCSQYYIFKKYYGQIDTQIQKATKPTILLDMLSLRDRLSSELFDFPHIFIDFDNQVKSRDLDQIIKFCEKHGYPFANELNAVISSSKLPRLSRQMLKQISNEKNIQFSVYDFIENLNEVYSTYQLSRIIINQSNSITTPVFTKGFFPEKTLPNVYIDLSKLNLEDCKNLFEIKYKSITFENELLFETKPYFVVKASNLFNAAFYQILLLTYQNEKEIRICPLCNSYFIPRHGNQKYCTVYDSNGKVQGGCYPQKRYKKEKSQRN